MLGLWMLDFVADAPGSTAAKDSNIGVFREQLRLCGTRDLQAWLFKVNSGPFRLTAVIQSFGELGRDISAERSSSGGRGVSFGE